MLAPAQPQHRGCNRGLRRRCVANSSGRPASPVFAAMRGRSRTLLPEGVSSLLCTPGDISILRPHFDRQTHTHLSDLARPRPPMASPGRCFMNFAAAAGAITLDVTEPNQDRLTLRQADAARADLSDPRRAGFHQGPGRPVADRKELARIALLSVLGG